MLRTSCLSLLAVSSLAFALVAGCMRTSPSSSPAPVEAATAPVATAPAADPTAAAPATETARPIKDVLGKVAKVEVREVALPATIKSTRTYTAPADIEAIFTAIGVDQIPSGPLRKCPDDIRVTFLDDAGVTKGDLGLCGALGDKLDGAEFGATPATRAGVTLKDAEALKVALAKAAPDAPKPATN